MFRNFQDLQKKMHGTLQFFLFNKKINCNLLLIKDFFGKIFEKIRSDHIRIFSFLTPLYPCQAKAKCKVASSQKHPT